MLALIVKIGADMRNFDREMKKLTKDVQTVGDKLKNTGKTLTAAITLPIVGLGAASIKVGMEFESSMSHVQAVTGATGKEMQELEKVARELGATTVFSASEAAQGMAFLGMAGYDTNQIIASMPGLLDLAAAGQLDLARAADITTNIMSGFNIEADKTGQVADILAKAASSANTSVEQMGDAMSYVAPVASGAGLSLEETAAAIGILSNAGIQGQRAGTALRGVIASLQNPTGQTKKALEELGLSADDVNPSMHSLTDILKTLEEAGMDSSQAMQLVGTQSGPALIAMMSQGSEGLAEFTNQLENSEGAAANMAETMQDNLQGRIKEMQSAFEEVGLTIYENLKPALEAIVEGVKSVADWFNNLSPEAQNLIIVIAGIAAAIGPLLIAVGTGIILFGQLKAALSILNIGFVSLTGPIGIAVAAIAALIAIGVTLWKNWDTIKAKASAWRDGVVSAVNNMRERFTSSINNLRDRVTSIFNTVRDKMVRPIELARDKIKGAIDRMTGFFSGIGNKLKINIPRPKLPRFTIKGEFSLMPPRVPTIGISWYAKGGIFDGASVIGVGEAGPEAVVPLQGHRMRPFAEEIARQMPTSRDSTGGNIIIQNMHVREESDIEKIAHRLFLLQRRHARAGGRG